REQDGGEGLFLYKSPPRDLVYRNLHVDLQPGASYELVVFKAGKRLKAFLDGQPVMDWWDHGRWTGETAIPEGYIGFAAAQGDYAISDFRVDEVTEWNMAEITELKDLSLETDLSDARICIGDEPAHQAAAESIASAVERQTGQVPEIVRDTEVTDDIPVSDHLICIGNMADNRVIRKLYFQWHCAVDRNFPGEDGSIVQTIHDPWGAGGNIVLVGGSDAAGVAAAAEKLMGHIDGPIIGRIYDLTPSEKYAEVGEWTQDEDGRLLIPAGFMHRYSLANYGSRDDPQLRTLVYLLGGDEDRAETIREQFLKWVDKGIINHLYVPSWMIVWDAIEEHPVFSDEDRMIITQWFLRQLRSQQCIGALHIQRIHDGMPHQNHGTRPALGTFFMARYFRDHYGLAECDMYLQRVADYFDLQADWSKPMEDSSGHQWNATLPDKAIYALASGHMRFFESGACRQAAERALKSSNNVGMIPKIGDAGYGSAASSLLSKAAVIYEDGRYWWPMHARGREPAGDHPEICSISDELARGFVGNIEMEEPDDIVGVSVIPYDEGFYNSWGSWYGSDPEQKPSLPIEKCFDKIAFRTGLDLSDQFLLLDGMVGRSHDYDDTNTIHEYSKNGRSYVMNCDGIFASTIAYENGVNIIRDGLSSPLPYFAENIHAADLGAVLTSQTKVAGFSGADWTRSVFMVPDGFFAVIDRMEAAEKGTFTFTGHWTTLGEPDLNGATLTVRQSPRDEEPNEENTTYFHMQAPADFVNNDRLEYLRYGRQYRYYPYAQPNPNLMAQSKTSALEAGESDFLYSLGHETGPAETPEFILHPVAEGVMRVSGPQYTAYLGAANGPVTIGSLSVRADLFYTDGTTLSVAGGTTVTVGDTTVLAASEPVTATILLETGEVIMGEAQGTQIAGLTAAELGALKQQLASDAHDLGGPAEAAESPVPAMRSLWEFDAGGQVKHIRPSPGNPGAQVRNEEKESLPEAMGIAALPSQAGHVSFVDAQGEEIRRIDVGAPVNDVAVDDIDRDGDFETLLARQDSLFQCLNADGTERWSHTHEQQKVANSALYISRVPMLNCFVAERSPDMEKTVCVSSGDQRLTGLTPDGEQKWMFWSYAGLWSRHGLYDIDGDGVDEICGGNGSVSSRDALYFLDGGDHYVKRIMRDGWAISLSSLKIGDINRDGREEIVIGNSATTVWALDPLHEEDHEIWSHKLGHDVTGIELVTADGEPMVIAGSQSGFVVAFNGSGTKLWATPIGGPVLHTATAGPSTDATIIVALQGGAIAAVSTDGTILRRSQLPSEIVALETAGPDHEIILAACDDGIVRALSVQ
ncbi:MAG: hypothetical protein R6V19_14875, partial [Armatimonadota bacterium]